MSRIPSKISFPVVVYGLIMLSSWGRGLIEGEKHKKKINDLKTRKITEAVDEYRGFVDAILDAARNKLCVAYETGVGRRSLQLGP